MGNIILPGPGCGEWSETPGERSLRQLGHRTVENAIMETGCEFGADELRSSSIGGAMQTIAKALWNLRQAMADAKWDDEKVLIVIGIQARNGWEKSCDGEWIEKGSPQWLARQVEKKG